MGQRGLKVSLSDRRHLTGLIQEAVNSGARRSECCKVLDGVDGGIVFECDKEVYNKYQLEHICDECLESSDEYIRIKELFSTLISGKSFLKKSAR